MFQNSLTMRIPLRCGEHPKNIITHFCTEARCEGLPLFCEECMASYRFKQKHYGHELSIHEISKGIDELCGRMERDKKTLSNIYRQIIGMKGAEGLLKWQQEKQQHFMSIEKHISTIKFQVEEELAGILQRFQQQLTQEKQKLYLQLQNYYVNYKEKFDKFSRLTEPIVAISNKFKFYASTSALFFKISSQAGTPKLAQWLNELKRTLSQSEKASAYPGEYIQQIRKYGDAANAIMDDLPRIRNEDFEKQMPGITNTSVREILRSLVRVRDQKPVMAGLRSNSMDSIPVETNSRKPAIVYNLSQSCSNRSLPRKTVVSSQRVSSIYIIMNGKRNSSISIRLPKINLSPTKTAERGLQRIIKSEQNIQPDLTAQSYGIYDLELHPLIQYNKEERRQIASLTKMMTLLCSIRLCKKLKINTTKCYFRVTVSAANTRGTTAELQSREWITVEDLLHGLMLPSGNDAAAVLAENLGACIYYDKVGQSHMLVDLKSLDLTQDTRNLKVYTEHFVKQMNIVAKQLGMTNTLYANPHGLDCLSKLEAYSVLGDQALLIKTLLSYSECITIIGKCEHVGQMKTIAGKDMQTRKISWQNTNVLLSERGFIGGKTGQTQFAGNCLASIYESKEKQKYIVILLGSSSKQARFCQTKLLVEKYVDKKLKFLRKT